MAGQKKVKTPVLEICIPSLPPPEFNPNSRAHHLARHKAGIVARDEVIARVRAAGYDAGVLDSPLVDIQWGVPDKRCRDWDNLIAACKPFIDGLVKAGVLRDDSIRDYQPSYGWFESYRHPKTEIRVYLFGISPVAGQKKVKTPVLEISIPSLPPKEFSPNSRAHHLARHAAGVIARDEVIARVLAAGYDAGVLDAPLVDIQWGVPDKRCRDWDNLIAACKPFIDGLVKAGVLRDDSIRDYQPSYGWFESYRHPKTEIRVYL